MTKIGLMVDNSVVPGYLAELVSQIEASDDLELTIVIEHARADTERGAQRFIGLFRREGIRSAVARLFFAILTKLERYFFVRKAENRQLLETHDLSDRYPVIRIAPIVSKSGFVFRFGAEDIAKLKDLQLDVLIRGGSGILRGDILRVARKGIISLHHADNRVNRGGPAGFWEVRHEVPGTGFIVQRLSEELDGGEVLFRGSFATEGSYFRNQQYLYARSIPYLTSVLRQIAEGREQVIEDRVYDGVLYKSPLVLDQVAYLFGMARRLTHKVLRKLLFRHRWEVAIVTAASWRSAVLWRAKPVKAPAGSWIADPFLFEDGGETWMLAERYVEAKSRGVIALFRKVSGKPEFAYVEDVLEEPFHLSFPFVFRHGGDLFMIPESADARQVRLYKADGGPHHWTLASVLIDNVDAVDTMVVPASDGNLGLLTSIKRASCGSFNGELHGYLGSAPDGPWIALSDPVSVSASLGRNGGMIDAPDGFYRVAQSPGFGEYGKCANVTRIDSLDNLGLDETLVQVIQPAFDPRVERVHHISWHNGLLAFDKYARRSRIAWWKPF